MLLCAWSLVVLVAAPGALAVPFVPHHKTTSNSNPPPGAESEVSSRSPFVPPAAKVKVESVASPVPITPRSPGSFKLDIGHRLQERSTAETGITFGSYWFASSKAGGQDVQMLIDTGSSDLWVVGPSTAADQQNLVKTYHPGHSKSAVEMQGHKFKISYGAGDNGVSGPVFQDTFSMGSASVDGMPIGSASSIQGIDPGTFKSGILGLGFIGGNSVRPNPQPTFMEALQPVLNSPVFTCNFKMGGGGSLEFGEIDESLFKGRLTTIRADNTTKYPASWSVEEVQYVSDGKTLGIFDIVFDTGGPSTSGPKEVVDAYYSQIKGAKDVQGDGSIYTVPCDTNMPDLEFHFRGGAVGKIPGSNLIQRDLGANTCQTWFGRENSVNRGLVGDAFFNSNVVVFNQAEATISWAPQA